MDFYFARFHSLTSPSYSQDIYDVLDSNLSTSRLVASDYVVKVDSNHQVHACTPYVIPQFIAVVGFILAFKSSGSEACLMMDVRNSRPIFLSPSRYPAAGTLQTHEMLRFRSIESADSTQYVPIH